MNDTNHQSEKYAFEPFGTLDGVMNGAPIRIFPTQTWYRDTRVLDLKPARLQEFARNIKSGLPRFEVPINIEHDHNFGRYGSVHDLEYMENGPDGPGLYATKYEFTPAGKKLIEEQKFKGVSGEAVWTLNEGSLYQDPKTGEQFDNVLVGLALTNSSFFGKDVALFSATPPQSPNGEGEEAQPMPDKIDRVLDLLQQLNDEFAVWSTAFVNDLPDASFLYIESGGEKDADGKTTPRSLRHFPYKDSAGKIDLPHLRNALARIPQSSLPADVKARVEAKARAIASNNGVGENASDENKSQEDIMSDKVQETPAVPETPTTPAQAPAPEGFSVKPDEFKALQEKAAQVDTLRAQADEFKAQLVKVQYDRDLDRMRAHADQFVALPIKADEMGKKLLDLKMADEELFGYFDGLLKQADELITKADLFGQISRTRPETTDTFEAVIDQVLAEKFSGDKTKYSEAMTIARERRPDLADAYLNRRG